MAKSCKYWIFRLNVSQKLKCTDTCDSCIFMGCVYAYTIILTFLGPEYLGRSLDPHADNDLVEAAGIEAVEGVGKDGQAYREKRNENIESERTDSQDV